MGRRNCIRMRLCFYVTFAYEKTEDLQTGTFSSSEFYENKKTPSCIRFINAYRHTSNIQHIGTCASEVTTLWRFTNMLIIFILIIIMYTTQIGHFWGGAWPHLSKAVRTTEMKLKQNSFKTVSELFWNCLFHFDFNCADSLSGEVGHVSSSSHDFADIDMTSLADCSVNYVVVGLVQRVSKNVTNLILKTLTKLNRFQ